MSSQTETAVSPLLTTQPANTAGKLILVIDDEEPVREAIVDIMELHGLGVVTAVNGQDGIAVFNERKRDIQLVVLDMSMPGMNGIETLVELRQINPEIPVILSSGYSQQQIAPELMVNGRTGFLAKPYNVDSLVSKVWHYLPNDSPVAP
jgi:DNA-binding NtrC family response regulator